eukprot:CAMPEP_0177623146 /NCGR_PEP_ID=MMETSP0419_2-20121207/28747_1 /TAXON_ID=582737 /ORGANISM="Tetraselmis sp., Strain GSL018" /LENGTH=362 /DNA_ID=CAMNT_0019123679 /DNA_START=145 /DNA_END=1230 /DNA_ORIENTATION=-
MGERKQKTASGGKRKKRPEAAVAEGASERPDESCSPEKSLHDQGRRYTVSMAVPGSVIDNTQSLELATAVAGQIARTAAIFNVNEVVVFDDRLNPTPGTLSAGTAFLARVLQFMETPQYLRRGLIPMHKDLRLAGMLPPLDAPHHMRANEWRKYREGAVIRSDGECCFCDIGLDKEAIVKGSFPEKTRLTLRLGDKPRARPIGSSGNEVYEAEAVSATEPLEKDGVYWGYVVRVASGLSAVLGECPFDGGYDLTIGTSEHGTAVRQSGPLLRAGGVREARQLAQGRRCAGRLPPVRQHMPRAGKQDDSDRGGRPHFHVLPADGNQSPRRAVTAAPAARRWGLREPIPLHGHAQHGPSNPPKN